MSWRDELEKFVDEQILSDPEGVRALTEGEEFVVTQTDLDRAAEEPSTLFYLEDGERFRDLKRPKRPWEWDSER